MLNQWIPKSIQGNIFLFDEIHTDLSIFPDFYYAYEFKCFANTGKKNSYNYDDIVCCNVPNPSSIEFAKRANLCFARPKRTALLVYSRQINVLKVVRIPLHCCRIHLDRRRRRRTIICARRICSSIMSTHTHTRVCFPCATY